MKRKVQDDNDDDAFDERGLLKDGRVYRVGMRFMDSASPHSTRPLVTDSNGDSGLGLQRPGFRLGDRARFSEAKFESYRRYEDALTRAWRGDARRNAKAQEDYEQPDEAEEDEEQDKTGDGRSLEQQMRDHERKMKKLYSARDRELNQAWRKS